MAATRVRVRQSPCGPAPQAPSRPIRLLTSRLLPPSTYQLARDRDTRLRGTVLTPLMGSFVPFRMFLERHRVHVLALLPICEAGGSTPCVVCDKITHVARA